MTLSDQALRALRPMLDELDMPTELRVDYIARVRRTLPNMPDEVIGQWFYDHHHVIEASSWLDYPSLTFSLTLLTSEQLSLPCLASHATVVQYRNYFVAGVDSPRMKKIASYIEQHGAWPVPPILMDNPNSDVVSPWGLVYSSPYDVIEGHHRLAVYYALKERGLTRSAQPAWMLSRHNG